MKALAAALALWTVVAVLFLIFDPGYQSVLLGCMRLVGRSATCEAQQQAINQAWTWLHTVPLILTIAMGYLAIVVTALVRRRRRLSSAKREVRNG